LLADMINERLVTFSDPVDDPHDSLLFMLAADIVAISFHVLFAHFYRTT